MPAIPAIIGVVGAVGAAKVAGDAQKKAAKIAAEGSAGAGTPTVDVNALQSQAQSIAQQNAANSAKLEAQYNPGAAALRTRSLENLTQELNPNLQVDTIANQIAAQAGKMPVGIGYDSPLLRDAIAKARSDLALGGQLPQEVRNLVMRQALAKSGSVSGGLNLGRDLGVRDLGLTSLDLENRRLQNAAALGGQEAGLGQGNANLSLQAQLAGTNNLFNSANFLQQIDSGNFAKQLAAAQLGQNIAQPMSGLDPSSVANLAVGNANATAAAQQQQAAIAAENARQKGATNSKLLGAGLGLVQNYLSNKLPAPSSTSSGSSYGDMVSSMNSFYSK